LQIRNAASGAAVSSGSEKTPLHSFLVLSPPLTLRAGDGQPDFARLMADLNALKFV
jgi:hypothetical protein